MVEAMKKSVALRRLYQRILCTPMEGSPPSLDSFWSEYEAFEKLTGDPATMEALISDFNKNFLHAKSICRERKRLTASLTFDRLSVPPTNSNSELNQLDTWNDWIRFEMGNPDNLPTESFVSIIRMLYDQCLCCFQYNPEVWLSYAMFEKQHSPSGSGLAAARKLILESIRNNEKVSLLYVALAELEEEHENFGKIVRL